MSVALGWGKDLFSTYVPYGARSAKGLPRS